MYRKAEMLERIQLRQSTIKDWLSCPLMFRFRHVEKLKPAYRGVAAIHGSALHLAIHKLHALEFKGDVRELYRDALQEVMVQDSDIPVAWKKSKEVDMQGMEDHAFEILTGYGDWEENRNCKLQYSEVRFKVKVGGYELTGTIDQVRYNSSGELDLVDLKSGMQRLRAISLHNDWQLSLYAYALKYGWLLINGSWVRTPISVDRAVIYHLRAHERYKRNSKYGQVGAEKGRPFIICQKPIWDHQRFKQDLLNIIKMMTRDWPFPNPNSCGFCAYQSICQDRTLLHASPQIRRVKSDLAELGMLKTTADKG
ncbi:MAG: PD-(D/E)XK nuclease family protein [Candidatus Marinimicrobia bacterium]|nr:PD-(D/E)XK nuclease family protein [Candidatus Neomarinimicrobiota bacterium]